MHRTWRTGPSSHGAWRQGCFRRKEGGRGLRGGGLRGGGVDPPPWQHDSPTYVAPKAPENCFLHILLVGYGWLLMMTLTLMMTNEEEQIDPSLRHSESCGDMEIRQSKRDMNTDIHMQCTEKSLI